MDQLDILGWRIGVDMAQTRLTHQRLPTVETTCSCDYCQNFACAIREAPAQFVEILSKLGIDLGKASEVYQIMKTGKGRHLYGGFYHIVGQLIESSEAKTHEESSQNPNDFEISFRKDLSLVPSGFPKPILQVEIMVILPWCLDKKE